MASRDLHSTSKHKHGDTIYGRLDWKITYGAVVEGEEPQLVHELPLRGEIEVALVNGRYQAITHVPHERAVLYSRIAMSATDVYEDAVAEWNEWGTLQSLSGPSRPFSEAEESQVRISLARAVQKDAVIRRIADATVERIKSTRLLDPAAFDAAVRQGRADASTSAMCRSIQIEK